jgi:DNA-binding response OmpR family regulator
MIGAPIVPPVTDSEAHGRVLVIDDTASARLTIDAILRSEGYELLLVDSGEVGLETAAREQPDAIVLDVMMPGLDGFTTCARLKENPLTASIPVLLVTALSDAQAHRRGLAAGADGIVAKPFERWELRARLGALVRLGRVNRRARERERLSTAEERTVSGFALLDANGMVRHGNLKFLETLGLGQDPSLALPFSALVRTEGVTVRDANDANDAGDSDVEPRTGPFALRRGYTMREGTIEIFVHGALNSSEWRILELRARAKSPPSSS